MAHSFITAEQLEGLPRDPRQAWAEVVRLTVEYVGNEVTRDSAVESDKVLTSDAANFLFAVSDELELSLAPYIRELNPGNALAELQKIASSIYYQAWVKKIGATVKSPIKPGEQLIDISNASLLRLNLLTKQLRIELFDSRLEERKRDRLLKRLDDFEREVSSKQVAVGRALSIIALIGAGVAGVTSTLADGPAAVETISEIAAVLGEELDSAEEVKLLTAEKELLRLPPPEMNGSEPEEKP